MGNVAKYSLPGKNYFNPTHLQRQRLLWSCRKVVEKKFYNQTKSFTPEDYANDREFSKQYWEIKWNNFIPKLTWSIVRECYDVTCNSSKRKCYLSLNEKVEINSYKGNNLLNQR